MSKGVQCLNAVSCFARPKLRSACLCYYSLLLLSVWKRLFSCASGVQPGAEAGGAPARDGVCAPALPSLDSGPAGNIGYPTGSTVTAY
jgi:hypothetical protein